MLVTPTLDFDQLFYGQIEEVPFEEIPSTPEELVLASAQPVVYTKNLPKKVTDHHVKQKRKSQKNTGRRPQKNTGRILSTARGLTPEGEEEDILEPPEEQSSSAEAELQEIIEKQIEQSGALVSPTPRENLGNAFLALANVNIARQEPVEWDKERAIAPRPTSEVPLQQRLKGSRHSPARVDILTPKPARFPAGCGK